MKLALEIRDDKDLRNCIKDMIRGTVTGMAREEITNIVAKVTLDKSGCGNEFIKQVVREQIAWKVQHSNVAKMISDEVSRQIKEMVIVTVK